MTKPLKVAVVAAAPFTCPRGTPVRVHRLAEALADRDHDVHVVTYHLGQRVEGARFTVHRIPNVPTYRRTAAGPSYQKLLVLDTLLIFKLRQVLSEHTFDLVYAHHYEGLMASLAARWRSAGRTPIVFDAHTLLESELPFYGLGLPKRLKRSIGRGLDHRLPRRANGIVAVSESIRDQLVREHLIATERIEVIGGGVELDLFSRGSEKIEDGNRKAKTLIYCGTLAAYQGIDLMLEAFAKVLEAHGPVRLLLATDSSLAPYEALTRRLGIRKHIDVVAADFSSLPSHLHRSDVALNPRPACDGYPQKVINYMAGGLPIVSSAGSAANLEHGETAWLVENGDASAFASGIVHLLDHPDLARTLGRNARGQIGRESGWDRAAAAAERFFRKVIERETKARSRENTE